MIMHLTQVADVLFAGTLWLLAMLPGGIVWALPGDARRHRLLLVPAGLATAATACRLGLYHSLTAAAALLILLAAVGAFALFFSGRWKGRFKKHQAFILLCGILMMIRLFPLTAYPEPRGFDPWFHLLIAQKIVNSGAAVTDWLPFAPIDTVNYPIAMHALMAVMSSLTGLPLPLIFSTGVIVMVIVLGIQIYLTLDTFAPADDRLPFLPLFSATAFAAGFSLGSFDYVFWGGLPNLLGMCILFGFVIVINDQSDRRNVYWALPLLLIGISLIHHHAMLVAGMLLGAEILRRVTARQEVRPLLTGALAAAVVGSWYYVPYAIKALRVSDSAVLSYREPLLTPYKIFLDGGPLFCLSVGIGAVMFWRNRREVASFLPPGILRAAVLLLGIFVMAEYIVRPLSVVLTEREVSMFTPSRFFTDAVPFLSVFAGLFFCRVTRKLRPASGILLLASLGLLLHLPKYKVLLTPEVDPEKLAAFAWIREHTAPETLVIDPAWSASYYTWRPTSHMPVPSSEFTAPVYARYQAVKSLLATGDLSEPLKGQPIVCIASEEEMRRLPLNAAPLWMGPGGLGVFRLN